MSFWVDHWLPYIFDCHTAIKVPRGVQLLNPYDQSVVRDVCQQFYSKYFGDKGQRTVLFGINPGRLGAGITGIAFTDPEKLENHCLIKNDFSKKEELSSKFIHEWILRESSLSDFYEKFIILSVCPLGFVEKGKNINYYDQPLLQSRAEKLIVQQQDFIHASAKLGRKAYMLGKGKNFKYFKKLNERHQWYDEVIALPHPRWVMQYRYKMRYELMDEMMLKLIE